MCFNSVSPVKCTGSTLLGGEGGVSETEGFGPYWHARIAHGVKSGDTSAF